MNKTFYALALSAACIPGAAFAQGEGPYDTAPAAFDKSGLRIEARGFYERIGDPEDDVIYELGDGIGFGVEAGYDFQVGDTVVVGPYVTYDRSTTEDCAGDFCVSSGGYLAAGLHVGIGSGGRGQFFVKGGYGQLTVDAEGTLRDGFGSSFVVDESESGGGYNVAFGYEHGFSESLYARGEVGIGESFDIYDFDFQRTNIGLSVGARF